MTQKTNRPDSSNSDDFTASDFSIRFIKLSQNEGNALGHKYQRQIMNSETQIRTTLTGVHYRQAPEKVIEVERIKEWKKEAFFDGSMMKWKEPRICNQTSLVLPLVRPGQTFCHSRDCPLSGYQVHAARCLILTINMKRQHYLLPFHSWENRHSEDK